MGHRILRCRLARGHSVQVDHDGGVLVLPAHRQVLAALGEQTQHQLGHPDEGPRGAHRLLVRSRLGGVGGADRVQGGPQHDGVLGVEPAREPDPGIGAVPEVDRLPAGRARVDRVGVVPVHAAQPGDHRLELSDGSVLGKYQQVSDQGILPGRGDAGDGARVGVGDPARPHRRRQSRERGERAGDPDVVAGGALSKPAVVGQPSRGGRQPVGIRAVAVVELGDQQQPPARRRGHPPGESHDLVSEVQQRLASDRSNSQA